MIKIEIEVSIEESGRKAPKYDINSDLNGEISLSELLAFTKQALIVTADEVLAEEQALGFDKTPVVLVDGRKGKAVKDVSPFGSLDFIARADMQDIIIDTYQRLLDKSPVLTGAYKASNYVFLNGKQVATDMDSLQAWLDSNPAFEDKDLVRFLDIQPYARKLERLGVTADRQQSRTVKSRDKRKAARGIRVSAPNGVYYLTTRAIRAKYKQNSIISFQFISGEQLGLSASFKARKGKPGRPYLYPSILISVQETGVV